MNQMVEKLGLDPNKSMDGIPTIPTIGSECNAYAVLFNNN